MRNLKLFPYFFAFLFILSACSHSSDCFRKDVFCAGLVTDTLGMDDHGINQDSWAGLREAKTNKLVDRIEYIESVDTRDYEKNITYFLKNGFDVIITSGAGLSDETLRSADLYRDSVFVAMNQSIEEVRPNIIPVTFAEDQMGFAAGALAARISQTRIVGGVCETSGIESMWRYCEGFRAGAKYLDETIKVQVIYHEDGSSEKLFMDEAWGHDTAQKLINRGADVIFAAGGVTGQGALRAADEVGVNAIGTERDQAEALGESGLSVVTSIFGNASFEIQNVLRVLRDGNIYEPRPGQIRYIPSSEKFPENLTQEMDLLLSQLSSGEIKTAVQVRKP